MSEKVMFTHHAESRLQQRGVPWRVVRIVLDNADRVLHAGAGCETHFCSRSDLEGLVASGAASPHEAACAARIAILVGQKGVASVIRPSRGSRGRRYRRQYPTRAARNEGH
jgi:hypothetical protein